MPGRIEDAVVDSPALAGNPLGDPTARPLIVYLPPGYDDPANAGRRYPSVYVIQGFASRVEGWRNRRAFRPTFLDRLDEVFAGDDPAPPAIVVFVDAFTAVGGSQFLDSPAIGRYHTYLCDDVVGFVDGRYRTIPAWEHRGIMGHSSGGYGAMVSAMLRPDVWGGMASHAGDALFELCYQKDFADCARIISRQYDGSFDRFWEDFRSRPYDKGGDFVVINTYAMAAAYSADADGTIHFPFDLTTGQLVPEVWDRWLAFDPEGFHDRNFHGVPYGVVYSEVSEQTGDPWSVTFSHEALELIADPQGNNYVMGPAVHDRRKKVFYWFEMCDAVSSQTYEIDGIALQNFLLPAYFEPPVPGARTNFLGTDLEPFGIAAQSYLGYYDPEKKSQETAHVDTRGAERLAIRKRFGQTRSHRRQ